MPRRSRVQQASQAPAKGPRLPTWVAPILCLIGSTGATVALCEHVLVNKIPPSIQGKWLVVEGELEGATLEFLKNGTMIGTILVDGRETAVEGQIQMEPDGFRVVEAIRRNAAWLGEPVGPRPPGLAHRMLGDG